MHLALGHLWRRAMSIRIMTAVWDLPLSDSEKIVLLALADNANDEGWCWPSIATLARKCSKSERTVQTAIRSLCDAGHLERKETLGKGVTYTVHPRKDCTPAKTAPPQPSHHTPAAVAPKPSMNRQTSEAKASSVARAKLPYHRLPQDWVPEKPLSAETQTKIASWPTSRLNGELENFRSWAANAKDENGRGRKLDWDSAWGNWLRRKADEQPANGHTNNGYDANGLGPSARAGLSAFGPRTCGEDRPEVENLRTIGPSGSGQGIVPS